MRTVFTPHIHICEVRLCNPKQLPEYCPYNGILSETEDECEDCRHFVTVNFDPEDPGTITDIIRE